MPDQVNNDYHEGLGYPQLVESFLQWDSQDVLFHARNEVGQDFLVIFVTQDEDSDRWLYTPISPERLSQVNENKIELYDAFKNSEKGYSYIVEEFYMPEGTPERLIKPTEIQVVKNEDITDDDLPYRGVFLRPPPTEGLDNSAKV